MLTKIKLEPMKEPFDVETAQNLGKCVFELKEDMTGAFASAFSQPYFDIPISTYKNHCVTSIIIPNKYMVGRPIGSLFFNENCYTSPDIFIVVAKTIDGRFLAIRFCNKSMRLYQEFE